MAAIDLQTLVSGALAVTLSLAAAQAQTQAQNWPTRPVTMVVPFAAGGPIDTVGRIMAPNLSEALGQQIVVENVGGAGGMAGALRVAKAAPDGSQFALGNAGTHAVGYSMAKDPPYHPAKDFEPVALFARLSLVLVTRKDLPAANLQEFIAYAKINPAKMQFASAGAGSATHLGCALLNAAAGIDVTHVPYRGGAPAMQDVVAGRIDYICIDTPVAGPLVAGGQLKALAVLTRVRSPAMPDLPTAQEQGLAGFEATNWTAFFLPKGTPAPIVQRLHAATVRAIESPDVQKRMKDVGIDPVPSEQLSQAYLATFVDSELTKWAGAIKASGLAPQ
jgi:tripartite-type tricarboxylate transporter receptor subunit TctC